MMTIIWVMGVFNFVICGIILAGMYSGEIKNGQLIRCIPEWKGTNKPRKWLMIWAIIILTTSSIVVITFSLLAVLVFESSYLFIVVFIIYWVIMGIAYAASRNWIIEKYQEQANERVRKIQEERAGGQNQSVADIGALENSEPQSLSIVDIIDNDKDRTNMD